MNRFVPRVGVLFGVLVSCGATTDTKQPNVSASATEGAEDAAAVQHVPLLIERLKGASTERDLSWVADVTST